MDNTNGNGLPINIMLKHKIWQFFNNNEELQRYNETQEDTQFEDFACEYIYQAMLEDYEEYEEPIIAKMRILVTPKEVIEEFEEKRRKYA